ncbi:hypothetical protein JR316_0000043 [Psilocybe cubensis]|uniref:Uncharacterized protein n=2 Tax=Psilocybe cubensis TaxID=181762 RepID=A0ACB8HET2_PSICU|nr:hypothetical protein JR316_0000043 [Psilocybe cubensis]KAH9485981.1 hypothetical protein JR316_0000043 [Psilocybe cubensis]
MAPNKISDPLKIMIPIMGATGAGKSSFINMAIGTESRKVGHNIQSCTFEVAAVEVPPSKLQDIPLISNRKVYLVDTPGFDNTYHHDVEILDKIATWLKESYKEFTICGVIYLHDISADRYTGTAKRNLQIFSKLCGDSDGVLDHVIIGLTKGSRIPSDEALRREEGLKERQWGHMLSKGVEVYRVSEDGTEIHPIDLLRKIFQKHQEHLTLRIQEEMTIQRKIVPQTDAGLEVRLTLEQILTLYKKQSEYAETSADRKAIEKKIEILSNQINTLEIPLSRRLRMLLGI